MKKQFLLKIKDILENQKTELLVQNKKEDNIIAMETVDMDGDEIDEIQGGMLIALNNQLNNRLSTRNADQLMQIERALKKIDEGNYGLCQDCKEAISEKRLLFNPHFQTCISCAEDKEDKVRRKI